MAALSIIERVFFDAFLQRESITLRSRTFSSIKIVLIPHITLSATSRCLLFVPPSGISLQSLGVCICITGPASPLDRDGDGYVDVHRCLAWSGLGHFRC